MKKLVFIRTKAHWDGCSYYTEEFDVNGRWIRYIKSCNCGIGKEEAERLEEARRLYDFDSRLCLCGCEDLDEEERQEILASKEYADALELLKQYGYIVDREE